MARESFESIQTPNRALEKKIKLVWDLTHTSFSEVTAQGLELVARLDQ
jgi:hypothetical protein